MGDQAQTSTEAQSGATQAYNDIYSFIQQGIAEVQAEQSTAQGGEGLASGPETPSEPEGTQGAPQTSTEATPETSEPAPHVEESPLGGESPRAQEESPPDESSKRILAEHYRLGEEIRARDSKIESLAKELEQAKQAVANAKAEFFDRLKADPHGTVEESGMAWNDWIKNSLEPPQNLKLQKEIAELKTKQEQGMQEFERFRKEETDKRFVRETLMEHRERWPRLAKHPQGVNAIYTDLNDKVGAGNQASFEETASKLEQVLWEQEVLEKVRSHYKESLPPEEVLEKVFSKPAPSLEQSVIKPLAQPGAPPAPAAQKPIMGNAGAPSTSIPDNPKSEFEEFRAKYPREPIDSIRYADFIMEKIRAAKH